MPDGVADAVVLLPAAGGHRHAKAPDLLHRAVHGGKEDTVIPQKGPGRAGCCCRCRSCRSTPSLADIQLLGSHMPDGPLLQVLIRQLEQRPGQPFGDVIFDEGLLHRRGKPQQPQLIAQGGGLIASRAAASFWVMPH